MIREVVKMSLEELGFRYESALFELYKAQQNATREQKGYMNKGEVFSNNTDFFKDQFGDEIMEALQTIDRENYNVAEKYVRYDDYMKLESTDYLLDWIDLDTLTDYVMENEAELRKTYSLEMLYFNDEYEECEQDYKDDLAQKGA